MAHSARVQRSRAEETAARPLTSAATRSHPGHPRSKDAALQVPHCIPRPPPQQDCGNYPMFYLRDIFRFRTNSIRADF